MPIGLQVFSESGSLMFDGSTKTSRILGSHVTTTESGSLTIPNDGSISNLFAYWENNWSREPRPPSLLLPPMLWVDGNTIYWEYSEAGRRFYYGDCAA